MFRYIKPDSNIASQPSLIQQYVDSDIAQFVDHAGPVINARLYIYLDTLSFELPPLLFKMDTSSSSFFDISTQTPQRSPQRLPTDPLSEYSSKLLKMKSTKRIVVCCDGCVA